MANNDPLLKTAKISVGVILAAISIPVTIMAANLAGDEFGKMASTVGAASARIAYFEPETDLLTFGALKKSQTETVKNVIAPVNYEIPEENAMGSGSAFGLAPANNAKLLEMFKPDAKTLAAIPYPDDLEDNDGKIESVHYGTYNDKAYVDLQNGGQVRNCTSVPNEILKQASGELPNISVDLSSSEPQVLIYHTHATESFEPYSRDYFDSSFTAKTTDCEKNMIAVGNAVCEELENNGVSVIHDLSIHDYPSYNNAYSSSRETISEILKQYPSIKVVLDIHRDGIQRQDGTRVAAVTEVNGKKAAQLMIISCCDDGSGEMPDYMENFKFASLLQGRLESDWKGLTRPILFDYRHYNQDLSTGGLLIEVGSHGNSVDEAVYSGKLLGRSLASALKELEEN